MPVVVVGFRVGSDAISRQVTMLLTGTGVLHVAHGSYGARSRLSRPSAPVVRESPVPRQVMHLREVHAKYRRKGYTRVLIPPVCLRLNVTEEPLKPQPWGPDAPATHPELMAAFLAAAPQAPVAGEGSGDAGELDTAVREFYTALDMPFLRRRTGRTTRTQPVRLPPRTAAALRVLTHGGALASPARRAVGYTVTADTVRLRVGRAGEDLDYRAVRDLQAALAAWLHLNTPQEAPGGRATPPTDAEPAQQPPRPPLRVRPRP